MSNTNTVHENDNTVESENKLGGFYRGFFLYGQNKGGYSMGLQNYETKIRKKIIYLKSEKKNVSNDEKKIMEREILFLKTKLINNTDNAIYNYLVDRVSKHNVVNMNRVKKTQKAIAEELGLEATSVSKSFKKLKELSVIHFIRSGNAFEKIFISPRVLWKKDVHIHRKMIFELDEGFGIFSRYPFDVDSDYFNPSDKKTS
ncbi:replication/maintenance protein RepL [Halomonas halocynthiae]|uniref:replication/maintenance protein RepL n=1 Tax=Halomonas halocynthiae TaxID=176290 RepID=UPI0004868390|nr:replication/maintenance protein RepL [Halomonas halocynthiae]